VTEAVAIDALAAAAERTQPAPIKKKVELRLVLDEEDYLELQQAQGLSGKSSNIETIKEAIKLLIKRKQKPARVSTKAKATANKSSAAKKPSAYVPVAVRKNTAKAYGYQCGWVAKDGTRCTETKHLQYDHRTPRAVGGEASEENGRLLCRAHNLYEAKVYFGAEFVEKKIAARKKGRSSSCPAA